MQIKIQAIVCVRAGAHRCASVPVSLLPIDLQVEFSLPVPFAATHRRAALRVPGVWQIVQEHELSAAAQPVAFGSTTTRLLRVRQGVLSDL